ncbi:MAG TPA: cell division FtsA domain-containing protein [Candidatus Micrarchaeia archaeon]|nr:cell division FtsA domain-containing protein [Candidatus Micrarchaeia archaeon]
MSPRLPGMGGRTRSRGHWTALDIGSSQVRALVVKREDDRAVILGVGRTESDVPLPPGGAAPELAEVVAACDRAVEAAEDMGGVVPTRAVIGIAGSQVRGFTTTVARARRRPDDRISARELDDHVEGVQHRALAEARAAFAEESGAAPQQVRLVHSTITALRIDDALVADPLRYQGERLEVTVFNTFALASQVAAVERIAEELDLELAATVAEPYAVARAATTPESLERGAVFIDVGAATTQVALVRGGLLEAIRVFGLGGRAFTRRLAADLGCPPQAAELLKVRHSRAELAGEERTRVHGCLAETSEVLAQGVALTLHDLAEGRTLPDTVRLCGGGALLPEVAEQLSILRWTEYLPFLQAPTFTVLVPGELPAVRDTTGALDSPADITAMGLAYHAVVQEEPEGDLFSGVLRRVQEAIGP